MKNCPTLPLLLVLCAVGCAPATPPGGGTPKPDDQQEPPALVELDPDPLLAASPQFSQQGIKKGGA